MISRRDFLQTSMAASAIVGGSGFGNWAALAAKQGLTQDQLLNFDTFGNVSLIHVTDIHAQLKPIYFREPEINLGVGAANGQMPQADLDVHLEQHMPPTAAASLGRPAHNPCG